MLATEYTTGSGDNALVQRWDNAIRYRIVEDYTENKELTLL